MRNRRWMYAVVTGLLLAGAARSVLAQNQGKDKETKEPTKEAAAPAPKRYLFEMRNKPWSGVFEWLVDQTGVPFSGENQPPAGTMTFIAPRVGNQPKMFTMPEIIDLINENLLPKKFLLL